MFSKLPMFRFLINISKLVVSRKHYFSNRVCASVVFKMLLTIRVSKAMFSKRSYVMVLNVVIHLRQNPHSRDSARLSFIGIGMIGFGLLRRKTVQTTGLEIPPKNIRG